MVDGNVSKLDKTDVSRLQHLFTCGASDISQFLLDAYCQCMRALYF